jgi:hypothetical protein
VVLADEDLNPVLVVARLEGGRRLAYDVLAVEEELREGALGTKEGVLVADSTYELLPRRLVHLAVLE